MLFNIVKVRLSLNYRLNGLNIKNIQGGIKDKIEEIQLKYIEIYCVDCYYLHGTRRRIRDTTKVRLIVDLQKLIMQRVRVPWATTFTQLRMPSYCESQCNGQHLRLINNAVILRASLQRATPLLHEERRHIAGLSATSPFIM